jgi:hypothetical protein
LIGLSVRGVGLLAPGLPSWTAARRILAGEEAYRHAPAAEPRPDALPPNERRRGARTVRWAIAAAQEALRDSGVSAADAASVFASSSGDGEVLVQILETLVQPAREVSPTRFHNSVHNAASGYWSIASGSRRAAVTLCAYDACFGAALLEAAALVHAGEGAVLLVAYDLPYPPPFLAVRPIREPLALALLLCADARAPALARWRIALAPEFSSIPATIAPMPIPELASNPAAHALPLLAAVARNETTEMRVSLASGGALTIETRP